MPKQSSPAPAFTFEDDRFSYGERRFVTLGLLKGYPCLCCTHRDSGANSGHILSQGYRQ